MTTDTLDKFGIIESVAAPLTLSNIDTDIISPMAALSAASSSTVYSSLERYAFAALRYKNGDVDKAIPDPSFPLNDPKFSGAEILITGENFGCGSSRETAPAGISALGVRCLIGTTFGDIFFNNCFQRGILPIKLNKEVIDQFVAQSTAGQFKVNLRDQEIRSPSGTLVRFSVNQFRKDSLLLGLDDISMTLNRMNEVREYQKADKARRPWVYRST